MARMTSVKVGAAAAAFAAGARVLATGGLSSKSEEPAAALRVDEVSGAAGGEGCGEVAFASEGALLGLGAGAATRGPVGNALPAVSEAVEAAGVGVDAGGAGAGAGDFCEAAWGWDAGVGWLRRCRFQNARTMVSSSKAAASFPQGTRAAESLVGAGRGLESSGRERCT